MWSEGMLALRHVDMVGGDMNPHYLTFAD